MGEREPKVSIFRAHFLDEDGRPKSCMLAKVSCAIYPGDLRRFLDDMLGRIEGLAIERGVPVERIFAVSAMHGNHGEPIMVELQEVPATPKWTTEFGTRDSSQRP